MSKKRKVLFIVPDGVGIRNYLYSKIISYLKEESDIIIWSPLPKEAFENVERLHNISIDYKKINLVRESFFSRLYREATTYARLIHNSKIKNNSTILSNWRPSKYNFKVKLLYRLAELFGSFLSKNYNQILKFENKGINEWSDKLVEKYVKDLELINPVSLFITHQRVVGLMPICLAAKQLNIKSTTAIFSWDNLPKARLCVRTDIYMVWSQWMKDEMKIYYPEISETRVKLVGTPQFEFYLDENRQVSRDRFAKQHELDPNRKWVCFSGDDITTSPYDQLFLADVAQSLYSEKKNIQIIFRRCPVDSSLRYDETLNTFKDFIIPIDPIWNIESETGWAGYFPKYDDTNMQINLAYHCSMVINLGSTMALDFATYNKPCLYLNYNPSTQNAWSTKNIYNFQHFKSMKNLDAVGWLNSKEDILKTVLLALQSPEDMAPDRKKWMQLLVLHPINQNSINVAKALV